MGGWEGAGGAWVGVDWNRRIKPEERRRRGCKRGSMGRDSLGGKEGEYEERPLNKTNK